MAAALAELRVADTPSGESTSSEEEKPRSYAVGSEDSEEAYRSQVD